MISKKQIAIWLVLITLPLVVTALVYPNLPNTIPTSTSFSGVVAKVGSRNNVWIFPVGIFIFFLISLIALVKKEDVSFAAFRLIRVGKYEKGTITINSKKDVYWFGISIIFWLDLMIFAILYEAYSFNPETLETANTKFVLIFAVLLFVTAIINIIVTGKRKN